MKTFTSIFRSTALILATSLILSISLAASSLWAQSTADATTDAANDTIIGFDVRHVNAAQASEMLEADPSIRVLDVRTGLEFGRDHLDGAINVNYYSLSFRKILDELDKDVTWLVHCKTGVRSGKTLPIMEELGFKHVVHMDGGIDSWRAADLPTVR